MLSNFIQSLTPHTGDNSAKLLASSFVLVLSFLSSVRIVQWLAQAGLPNHPQLPMPVWSPHALGVSVLKEEYRGADMPASNESVVVH
jgi:hypothetical protein